MVRMDGGSALLGSTAVIETLEQWGVKDRIIGGVFDTTNTNSGGNKGIMVLLEGYLGRKVLHLYCRHHSYERFLNDAAETLLGQSKAPETGLYKELQAIWKVLDLDQLELLPLKDDRSYRSIREEFIVFGQNYLINGTGRGDYKEMVALSLLLLGDYPSELPPYHIMSIGCVSSARWMAKINCELKIALFGSQLVTEGMLTKEEVAEHVKFSNFVILFYVKQWLETPLTEDAALNDLALYKSLMELNKGPHLVYASAYLKRMHEHLWYLSEELVIFTLFSSKADNSTKTKCAKVMLKCWTTKDVKYVPRSKLETPLIRPNTKPWDLFGPKSWLLFSLMGIETKSFVEKPVVEWGVDAEYLLMSTLIRNVPVVNDAAERGVLLAKTVQNKVTRDDLQRQHLFLSIPAARAKLGSLCKKNLIEWDFTDL